jgi:hypothetical protein
LDIHIRLSLHPGSWVFAQDLTPLPASTDVLRFGANVEGLLECRCWKVGLRPAIEMIVSDEIWALQVNSRADMRFGVVETRRTTRWSRGTDVFVYPIRPATAAARIGHSSNRGGNWRRRPIRLRRASKRSLGGLSSANVVTVHALG